MTFPKLTINSNRDAHEARRLPRHHVARKDGGRYLTDGIHLYRAVGTVGETAATGLIGLEDCRSLDVILVAPENINQLRTVEPVAS